MCILLQVIFTGRVVFGQYNTSPNVKSKEKLPFKCPYEVPEGTPTPSSDLTAQNVGGLEASLFENGDLDDEPINTYAQYRAALALVPCNARALSVFPKDQLGSNFTVAVIFVYEKSVEELKQWLK